MEVGGNVGVQRLRKGNLNQRIFISQLKKDQLQGEIGEDKGKV